MLHFFPLYHLPLQRDPPSCFNPYVKLLLYATNFIYFFFCYKPNQYPREQTVVDRHSILRHRMIHMNNLSLFVGSELGWSEEMDSNYYTEERLQKNLNQQSKTDDRKTESENFLGNLWLKYIFFFHHLANFLYFHQHKILQHPFFFNQKSPTPLMEQNRRLYREGKSRVDFWGK